LRHYRHIRLNLGSDPAPQIAPQIALPDAGKPSPGRAPGCLALTNR
jgi:hypothetical protein